ncbi:hypothetical protein NPIL_294701, partial [Nephila pilipes]
ALSAATKLEDFRISEEDIVMFG